MTARFLITFCLACLVLSLSAKAYSQTINQVATNLEITNFSQAKIGMIVSTGNSKYSLTTSEYDPGMYGVIVSQPALVLNKPSDNSFPVASQGQVLVLVTTNNGKIKAGDLITSSKDIGIGQKATHSGHVLGKALADYSDSQVGLIAILLNINYNQVSAQSEGLTNAGIDQVTKKITGAFITGNLASIFKYLFAILLGSSSFFLGLNHFVRINRSAVEAIARNPLAKGQINQQILIGNIVVIGVCSLGLALALGILFFL